VGVVATWSAFRTTNGLSEHAYNRLVLLNDVSWALFALGAVGVGVSFALPEAHDMVAVGVQAAGRGRLRVGLGPGTVVLSGAL
jgi:hypothetical protein